jgi:hypothetical protein
MMEVGRKAAAGSEEEGKRYPMYMTAVEVNFEEDVVMWRRTWSDFEVLTNVLGASPLAEGKISY